MNKNKKQKLNISDLLKKVRENPEEIREIPIKFRTDRICMEAIKKSPRCIKYVHSVKIEHCSILNESGLTY
jgi:hypothetical protein